MNTLKISRSVNSSDKMTEDRSHPGAAPRGLKLPGATTSKTRIGGCPKIGLLALTLELYETMAPQLRGSREAWLRSAVIPHLEQHGEVLFSRAVFRREDIEAEIGKFESSGADLLLIVLATYSPSQLSLPALKRTRLPIAIWNTQQLLRLDDKFTMSDMIDNHGVHGTQDLANVLVRAGVPFHYVTSPDDDEEALDELRDLFCAAAATHRLGSARIGLMGYPFPGMGDFAFDSTHMAATLGCSWANLPVEDFILRCRQAPPEKTAAIVDDYRRTYEIAPDVTDQDLRTAAAAEHALRGMIEANKLEAITYQFTAFGEDERTLTLPFVAASRLMADGIGFGGEGDVIAAAATAFFNWLQPPATFSEMFTVDFAGEALLMSHMGEANVAMARRGHKVALIARPTPITRTRERQLALITTLQPGPATLAALTPGPAGKWRIIASAMHIEDFGPLPGFCVPHWKLRPATGNVRRFLSDYARSGGPHHNGLLFGDARRRLRFAAGLIGADYLEI